MPIMEHGNAMSERVPKLERFSDEVELRSRKRTTVIMSDDQRAKSNAKKKKSSEKERFRNTQIKQLLEEIRRHVPFVEKNLSKIRTLRLASEYINHLKRILNNEVIRCSITGNYRSINIEDFKNVVMREMQITNSYKERAEIELGVGTESAIRRNSRDFDDEFSFLWPDHMHQLFHNE